jgi:hypothetical protein
MYCSEVFLGDEQQSCHKLQNLQERVNKLNKHFWKKGPKYMDPF